MISSQPYKGSRDFYPAEMRIREWFFNLIFQTVESFGFEKIDAPILEPLDIYVLKTSEEIVNQQIYSFEDRGGRQVAIRPEMTPTVSRMVAQKIRELPKPIRWYSLPNLWRYERPGKGRLREHWQLNADIFAAHDELVADIEIIQLAVALMKNLGAQKGDFLLKLNHRGILNYFFKEKLKLPSSLFSNVARILDKKEKLSSEEFIKMLTNLGIQNQEVSHICDFMESDADALSDFFGKTSDQDMMYLKQLISLLHDMNLSDYVKYDPSVVRGFDYYTGIVFEVFDTSPENSRSIFGGGRYNNLVSHFAKAECNAVGFGMGDVTCENFLKTHNLIKEPKRKAQIYVASFPGVDGIKNSFQLAYRLRQEGLYVEVALGGERIKKQLQEAGKKNITFFILQGEDEIKKNVVSLKDLQRGQQIELSIEEAIKKIKKQLVIKN